MLCVCVGGVMDLFFLFELGGVELQVFVDRKYECVVMHILYVSVLCAFCDSPQCSVRHDL